jgi:hypothetical protein
MKQRPSVQTDRPGRTARSRPSHAQPASLATARMLFPAHCAPRLHGFACSCRSLSFAWICPARRAPPTAAVSIRQLWPPPPCRLPAQTRSHYYSKFNGGGQTIRLRQKVTVNQTLTEAVAWPALVNRLSEAGSVECLSWLIDRKDKRIPNPSVNPFLSPRRARS